jgi:predicted dienelactone hydrolase
MPRQAAQFFFSSAMLLVLALGVSTRAQEGLTQSIVPKLPLPAGTFGVGRTSFDWVDPNRAADMAEDRGPRTELMVYVWYPIKKDLTKLEVKSTLFPGAKQIDASSGFSAYLKAKIFGGNWPQVVADVIRSHARENAQIAKNPKAFPVVVFSPGAFGTCFQYSSAIEDLVSHGYVVAAIEHTSEVFGVLFQDGQVHIYAEARIPKQAIPPSGS